MDLDPNHLRLSSQSTASSGGGTLTSSPQALTFQNSTSTNGTLDSPLMPAYIPINHGYRTLVLCFDGTGDQYVAIPPFSFLCSVPDDVLFFLPL